MTSNLLFKCYVILAFYGSCSHDILLELALNTFLSTVSSFDKKTRLNVKRISGIRASKILSEMLWLNPHGPSSLLLPRDMIPLCQIPHIDVGLDVTSATSFTSFGVKRINQIESAPVHPFRSDHIALGEAYRYDALASNRIKYIRLDDLRRHTLIVGKTGSGKSTTKNRIVIDAWRNGIPTLLIEPVKTEARMLMGAIPELKVFTVGDETVTPFRLNPFHVEEGVKVQLHINLLYSCFLAAWPLYGILANHLRRVLVNTYINNGWDPVSNIRGHIITLDKFREQAEQYCDEVLMYGSELSNDFRGALLARAEDLCDPSRAVIFNNTENLPISELLSTPTILELAHLGDQELIAFVLNLILTRVYEHLYTQGPSDRLRYLISIDEAHRVLEELPKTLDVSEAALSKRLVIDQQVNLIAESRSFGLGFIISDQSPTRLARDAIRNCHTLIIHRLDSPDDQELMGSYSGCNPRQKEHLANLRIGEAVVRDLTSPVPFNVQVFHDPDHFDKMNDHWTDEKIKLKMKRFYDLYPEYSRQPEIPEFDYGSKKGSPTTESQYPVNLLDDIVQTKSFRELYHDIIEILRKNQESSILEEFLVEYIISLSHQPDSSLDLVSHLIDLVHSVYGPPPREPNMHLIQCLLSETKDNHECGIL